MCQTNIMSSFEKINFHRFLLLTISVVLISDKAEPCRGGRIIGRKSFFCRYYEDCFLEHNIEIIFFYFSGNFNSWLQLKHMYDR